MSSRSYFEELQTIDNPSDRPAVIWCLFFGLLFFILYCWYRSQQLVVNIQVSITCNYDELLQELLLNDANGITDDNLSENDQ